MRLLAYDLETLKNFFLFQGKSINTTKEFMFEISPRKNQITELLGFLNGLRDHKYYMVGYNNLGFDYHIIHDIFRLKHGFTYRQAYERSQEIINTRVWPVPFRDREISQIDLMKVWGFDNFTKRKSLKELEIAMNSPKVMNLPVPIGEDLTESQMDLTIEYGMHDVRETTKLAEASIERILFRNKLKRSLFGDVLNYSDTKIGEVTVIDRIGRTHCYEGRKPRQTKRDSVNLKDLILPNVEFYTEECQKVLDWFRSLTVKEDREGPKLDIDLFGIPMRFALGGAHGAKASSVFKSDAHKMIEDLDVKGMYPHIIVANKFSPEHLGQKFVKAFEDIVSERDKYEPGSPINEQLKKAGNSGFGKAKDKWSPLYDPALLYRITVNGQLQILMLAERLFFKGCQIIQVNTDGITIYRDRGLDISNEISDWEAYTGLTLKSGEFKEMYVRNVNAYFSIDLEDKLKLKKEYWYPQSQKERMERLDKANKQRVVAKCAVLASRRQEYNMLSYDPYDYCLSVKSTGKTKYMVGDTPLEGANRYYISISGKPLTRIQEPTGPLGQYKRKPGITNEYFDEINSQLIDNTWDERIHTKNESKYERTVVSIHKDYLVKIANDINCFDYLDVNWDYYKKQIKEFTVED